MRLLVVEDDDGIAEPLVTGLRREGFDVDRVATGADALAAPTIRSPLPPPSAPLADRQEGLHFPHRLP